jgi:hypothetical protein
VEASNGLAKLCARDRPSDESSDHLFVARTDVVSDAMAMFGGRQPNAEQALTDYVGEGPGITAWRLRNTVIL